MAVSYHDGLFPPENLDWEALAQPLDGAADMIARYDSFLGISRIPTYSSRLCW